jgi:hypothetical protein
MSQSFETYSCKTHWKSSDAINFKPIKENLYKQKYLYCSGPEWGLYSIIELGATSTTPSHTA